MQPLLSFHRRTSSLYSVFHVVIKRMGVHEKDHLKMAGQARKEGCKWNLKV